MVKWTHHAKSSNVARWLEASYSGILPEVYEGLLPKEPLMVMGSVPAREVSALHIHAVKKYFLRRLDGVPNPF